MAIVETPQGRFVGRNPANLSEGMDAYLFVRPEAMQWAHDAGLTNLDPKSLEVRDNFLKHGGGKES
jgi:hypothetical protein